MAEVIVCADAAEIAQKAVELVRDVAVQSIAERGVFDFVLSGGSTPERLYKLLALPPYADSIAWNKTRVFMGDERFVRFADPSSNWGMAKRTLLDIVPIPPANLFPIPTDVPTPTEAAERYEATLAKLFPDTLPVFDLLLLGLGDDGHTASLFPGKLSLTVLDKTAVATSPGVLPPPVDRITLTFPVLNAARRVLFLVAGKNKAEPLKTVLSGTASVNDYPAVGISPADGTLTFLIDEAANA